MKMSRIEALHQLCNNAFYGKQIKRVDKNVIIQFVENNDDLGFVEFERAAQRLFMDKPNKPKLWTTIEDILVAINSKAFNG